MCALSHDLRAHHASQRHASAAARCSTADDTRLKGKMMAMGWVGWIRAGTAGKIESHWRAHTSPPTGGCTECRRPASTAHWPPTTSKRGACSLPRGGKWSGRATAAREHVRCSARTLPGLQVQSAMSRLPAGESAFAGQSWHACSHTFQYCPARHVEHEH